MARWYEGAEEAAFKPVAGGYVFQPPSLLWPFTRSGCYLVNEAQKAALAACLLRQRRQVFVMVVAYLLIVIGLMLAAGISGALERMSNGEFIAILAVTGLVVVPIVIVPHFRLMRTLRPLLAGLPRSAERITLAEQLHGLAGAISNKLLVLGAIGGSMMVLGNLGSLIDAIVEGRGDSTLFGSMFEVLFGALLTSYFAYLAILKRRLKQKAS
jgi:uncharacterized Tic20 family protein